jgi:hypothetical protein
MGENLNKGRKYFKFECIPIIIAAYSVEAAIKKAKEIFGEKLYEDRVVWEQLATIKKMDFNFEDRKDIIEV